MMGWSLSLGKVAGTEIRIHFTFFLLILWFGLAAAMHGGAAAGLDAVAFILAVFCCVVLHEYGHILTAAMAHLDQLLHAIETNIHAPEGRGSRATRAAQ